MLPSANPRRQFADANHAPRQALKGGLRGDDNVAGSSGIFPERSQLLLDIGVSARGPIRSDVS